MILTDWGLKPARVLSANQHRHLSLVSSLWIAEQFRQKGPLLTFTHLNTACIVSQHLSVRLIWCKSSKNTYNNPVYSFQHQKSGIGLWSKKMVGFYERELLVAFSLDWIAAAATPLHSIPFHSSLFFLFIPWIFFPSNRTERRTSQT